MTRWISQKACPSTTPDALKRTGYLAPLADAVKNAIRDYLGQRPDAEDVTAAVFEKVGHTAIESVGSSVKPARRNTDMGLFVAQKLVELYGEEAVFTLRQDDGTSAQTRPHHRPALTWVTAYTPHRVLLADGRQDRILLDTSAVRKVIHGDADALDLAQLKQLQGQHRVSLADGAVAELAAALTQSRIKVADWAQRIHLFDDVIDPDLPFMPGGNELAVLAGLRAPAGFDLDDTRAYYCAVWRLLRAIQTDADLVKAEQYVAPNGDTMQIRFDGIRVENVLEDAADAWKMWVDSARLEKLQLEAQGGQISEDELAHLLREEVRRDVSDRNVDKLEVAIRVSARRTFELKANKGYSPKGHNDALDFDLLYGLALPAVVCTGDDRLVRLARSTTAWDGWRVMNAAELLAWLQRSG
jgi:hypothetical protein